MTVQSVPPPGSLGTPILPPGHPVGGLPPPPPVFIPVAETRVDRMLRHVPVLGIGLINVTLSHWGSAVLLKGVCEVFPDMAPKSGVPTWGALHERFWANIGFGALIAVPLFTGFECICSKNPEGRAKWRRWLRVDPIQNGIKRLWNKFIGSSAVRKVDGQISALCTRRSRVPDGGGQYVDVDVNHWGSVKEDVATVGLYVREFVLRGVVGVTNLLTRRMPKDVGWASKMKSFLQSSPLQRFAHFVARRKAVRTAVTPSHINRFQVGGNVVVDELVDELMANRAHVEPSGAGRLGRVSEMVDGVAYFVGRAFPGTRGRFAGSATDLAANVGTDVISADILAGGTTSFVDTVGPSGIISVAGALTNGGLTAHMRSPENPRGWTYGQTYTRRMLLGVSRSWVFRAFCVGKSAPWYLKYGAQVAISLYSLFKAGQWAAQLRRETGLSGGNVSALSDAEMRVRVRADIARYMRKGS